MTSCKLKRYLQEGESTTVFYQVLGIKALTQVLQGVERETIKVGLSEGGGGWSRTSRMNHVWKLEERT